MHYVRTTIGYLLLALTLIISVNGLLVPQAYAAECDIDSITAHKVAAEDAITHITNLAPWPGKNNTNYSDFWTISSGGERTYTNKIRYIIQSHDCANTPLRFGLYMQEPAPTLVKDVTAIPDTNGRIIVDIRPGEENCHSGVCLSEVRVYDEVNDDLIYSDTDVSSYKCNSEGFWDIACDDEEKFSLLDFYPKPVDQNGTGVSTPCAVTNIASTNPYVIGGAAPGSWIATVPILFKLDIGFTNGCIGQPMPLSIQEFDLADPNDEVLNTMITVTNVNTQIVIQIGNIPSACDNTGTEEYIVEVGTDGGSGSAYKKANLFNYKCGTSNGNVAWKIFSSNGNADSANTPIWIGKPIATVQSSGQNLQLFSYVKSVSASTVGYQVFRVTDDGKVMDTTVGDGAITVAATNGQQIATDYRNIVLPEAITYKIVGHVKNADGDQAFSSQAMVYDAASGTELDSVAFDSNAAKESATLAEQGSLPVYVDPTHYKLLEPLGSIQVVQTDSVGVYVNLLIEILLGIIGVMAVLVLIFAGVEYMTTQAVAEKGESKKMIGRAFGALICAASVYLILNTVNPDLLDLDPEIPSVTLAGNDGMGFEATTAAASNQDTAWIKTNGKILTLNKKSGGSITVSPCDDTQMQKIQLFGLNFTVHASVVESLKRIDAKWKHEGGNEFYRIPASSTSAAAMGGYACRSAKGSKFISWHSYGLAIDINPKENPFNSNKTNMPAKFIQMWKEEGWGWGGDWNKNKDPMHFSKVSNEGGDMTVD